MESHCYGMLKVEGWKEQEILSDGHQIQGMKWQSKKKKIKLCYMQKFNYNQR